MRRLLRSRTLLLAAAVVVALAAATAAVVMAAEPATHHGTRNHRARRSARMGVLTTAASYLGSTPAQLRSELRPGKSLAEIANATAGKSAAGLIHALEAVERAKLATASANLPSRVSAEVDRTHTPGLLESSAGYLGVGTRELRAQLRAGKTLAQIAASTAGKSEAGLVAALVAARKTALAAAVKAGTVTQARENALLPKLESDVSARIHRARRSLRG